MSDVSLTLSQSSCNICYILLYFLSLVQLKRGVIEWLWWASGIQAGSAQQLDVVLRANKKPVWNSTQHWPENKIAVLDIRKRRDRMGIAIKSRWFSYKGEINRNNKNFLLYKENKYTRQMSPEYSRDQK